MSEETGVSAAPSSGGDEISLLARAKTVFLSVRELGLVERQEAVDAACGDDAALKELVWTLLRGDEGPLAIESLADDIRAASEGEKSDGNRIGNYRLLERVGEGGFGVVYAAEQERPVRRRVALKIIKLGMDTKQVVARFEAERQALAMMDHPCIARVYDGGVTPTGRPYFVMELVKGVPITHYCDEQGLSIAQRLALVVRVCDALRHAHQKGVIHRDIKPSNVLITTLDGKAEPKIIDFGVAKAVSGKLTDRTLFTEVRQVIGTPEYMSPEQADPTVQDVDTRADVYGVGVLMYELLTGTTPFSSERLRTAAYGEMQRIIREEEPPAPSTRARSASRNGKPVRGRRSSELPSTLRGELDWIVLKAMEKDRARRYPGVGALASDIERYLAGEAVHAVPPSRAYLLKKFVRRHRTLVIASSALVASLVLGLAGTVAGLIKTDSLRRLAEEERAKADVSAEDARRAESLASRRAYSASLMSASGATEAMQASTAASVLDSVPSGQRGWEWRVLNARRDSSVRTIKTAIEYTPQKEVFRLGLLLHPDGKTFFTYDESADTCARRFDLATGQLLGAFAAPRGTSPLILTRVSLSPEGDRLFGAAFGLPETATSMAWVRVWMLNEGNRETTTVLPVPGDAPVDGIALSKDGKTAVLASKGMLACIEVATGALLACEKMPPLTFPLMNWSPTREVVATGETAGGWFGLRDTRSLKPLLVAEGHGVLMDAAISSDGQTVASAADDDTARLWDLERIADQQMGRAAEKGGSATNRDGLSEGSIPSKVLRHPGRVGGVVFSHDSKLVATVCGDSAVRIWDRTTGGLRETFATRDLVNRPLMFTADDKMIAAMHKDGTVRFWDLDAESSRVLRGHVNIVSTARFVRQGIGPAKLILSGGWDQTFGSAGIVRLWDAASGEAIGSYAGKPGDICRGLAVSSDGRLAAVGITEMHDTRIATGRLVMLDLVTGKEVWERRIDNTVTYCEFGVDDRTVLFRASDATLNSTIRLLICEASTGKLLHSKEVENQNWTALALSPDRRTLAMIGRDAGKANLLLVDGATLESMGTLPMAEGTALGFSPDGKRLAAASENGEIHVFDLASKERIARFTGHGMLVLAIAYSPDGTRIASAGMDRKIRLWDAKTFDAVGFLCGHTGHIGSLDWEEFETSAGKKEMRLLSCSGDGTVRIWEPVALKERLEARERHRSAMEKAKVMVEKWIGEKGVEGARGEIELIEDAELRRAGEEWMRGVEWKRAGGAAGR